MYVVVFVVVGRLSLYVVVFVVVGCVRLEWKFAFLYSDRCDSLLNPNWFNYVHSG